MRKVLPVPGAQKTEEAVCSARAVDAARASTDTALQRSYLLGGGNASARPGVSMDAAAYVSSPERVENLFNLFATAAGRAHFWRSGIRWKCRDSSFKSNV